MSTPEIPSDPAAATLISAAVASADSSHILHPGDRLDHFSIVELLSRGGMGAVYLAQDDSLQRTVAIKVLTGRQGEETQARHERLVQEARAQARVSHPNVVHIYYVGRHGDHPFFAMEYVRGKPLSQLIAEQRLPFEEISRIAIETVEALRHSARLGVIHGDVKPGNILVDEAGTVKLSDFGLARDSAPESSHSGPSGTLDYMAPEVAAGQAADPLSDQFSLGVMLYQMTFGELPLSVSSFGLKESLQLRSQANIKLPTQWPVDRPTVWKPVLERLLERNRDLRFPSYEELLPVLAQLQPVPLQRAGRVGRMISWILDQLIIALVLAVGVGVGMTLNTKLGLQQKGLDLIMEIYLLGVCAAAFSLSRSCQGSPGQKLLQLRVVDEFGLPPATWRGVLSLCSAWMLFIVIAAETFVRATLLLLHSSISLPQTLFLPFMFGAAGVWIVLNGVWLAFSQHQQSLTDRILHLFVVLDSRAPVPTKSVSPSLKL